MRHREKLKRFGRPSDQRKALMKSLVRELFIHETIVTSTEKAKSASMMVEKMITHALRKDLSARRYVNSILNDRRLTNKIVDEIAPRYDGRNGGYTRILKLRKRRGDGAELAIFQLIKEK